MSKLSDGKSPASQERGAKARGSAVSMRPPIPLLAMNGALGHLPHHAGVRDAVDLLCRGSPTIRTGSACDLSCTYCCVGADGAPLQTKESLCQIIDGLADQGRHGIGYMGGEPTLHPAFLEVVRHAKARGFTCQMLCTNGLKMGNVEFAARAFEAGITAVCTSLDAFDSKVQEPLYGGRGSHRQALDGLLHALEAPGVEVLVSAVVTALNGGLLASYMQEVAKRQRKHKKPLGVMMCVLQQPAKKGPEQDALALGLLESARFVRDALIRAQEVGVSAFTFGFPPCLLEGYEQHVSELYASEWVLNLDTGTAERSKLHDASTYWEGCPTCPHAGYCPGVMKQYASDVVRAAVASRAAFCGGGARR